MTFTERRRMLNWIEHVQFGMTVRGAPLNTQTWKALASMENPTSILNFMSTYIRSPRTPNYDYRRDGTVEAGIAYSKSRRRTFYRHGRRPDIDIHQERDDTRVGMASYRFSRFYDSATS
jgi:hypothetical protein